MDSVQILNNQSSRSFGQSARPIATDVAKPPCPPPATPGVLKAQADHAAYMREREALEARSSMRGLIWLALLALAISLFRAGANRAFYAGWWRQW